MEWINSAMGCILAAVAAVCFTFSDLLVFATRESSSQAMIFTANAVPGLFLCVLFMLCRKPDFSSIYAKFWWVVISGFLQAVAQFALLYAIPRIGPGNTKALYFTLPIFVIVLSHIFLGDPITRTHVVCAICSVLGVALVTRSEMDSPSPQIEASRLETVIMVFLALLAAISYAIVLIIRRFLIESKIDSLPLLFSFFVQFSIVSCLLCTVSGSWDIPDDPKDIIMSCSHGPLSSFGFLLVFTAVEYAIPSTVTIITPLNVPLDYAAQLFLFRSLPVELMAIAGACLTVGSSASVALLSIFETFKESPGNIDNPDEGEKQRLTE